jgi:hypothetical protein
MNEYVVVPHDAPGWITALPNLSTAIEKDEQVQVSRLGLHRRDAEWRGDLCNSLRPRAPLRPTLRGLQVLIFVNLDL